MILNESKQYKQESGDFVLSEPVIIAMLSNIVSLHHLRGWWNGSQGTKHFNGSNTHTNFECGHFPILQSPRRNLSFKWNLTEEVNGRFVLWNIIFCLFSGCCLLKMSGSVKITFLVDCPSPTNLSKIINLSKNNPQFQMCSTFIKCLRVNKTCRVSQNVAHHKMLESK